MTQLGSRTLLSFTCTGSRSSWFQTFLTLLVLPLSTVAAEDEIAKRLDEPLNGFARQDHQASRSPSFSMAPVYEKGYGLANLECDVPVTPQTVYHVASVSKQFTVMALVLLEEDGKLSLEDGLHKYLPELPDYGHLITIRHLLLHTSGIRDQWQTLALAGWRLDDVITQEQILHVLFRQKELNFVPGTKHLYSNGGYTLAAEILARVSGKPFPDFCRERIFEPLGMAHTLFHIDHRRLFTTAPDLARWLDNFREPKWAVVAPSSASRNRPFWRTVRESITRWASRLEAIAASKLPLTVTHALLDTRVSFVVTSLRRGGAETGLVGVEI